MTEIFAATYAESRRKQLGFTSFDLMYQQYSLRAGEVVTVSAVNKMYLVVGAEGRVRVLSELGQYYLSSTTLAEQKHEHSGPIRIQNNDSVIRTISFVVVTWHEYIPKELRRVPPLAQRASTAANSSPTKPETAPADNAKVSLV